MWSFRGANEKNKLLLINYKKSLQYSNINKDTIKAYQKDVYGLMLWLQDKDIDTLPKFLICQIGTNFCSIPTIDKYLYLSIIFEVL